LCRERQMPLIVGSLHAHRLRRQRIHPSTAQSLSHSSRDVFIHVVPDAVRH
jgi:hypothetical protein